MPRGWPSVCAAAKRRRAAWVSSCSTPTTPPTRVRSSCVVRAVEELVPRLVLERPGQLSFPTRGPSRYFGGDDTLATRIVARVHELGVADVRTGIAEGTFAAGLAARGTEERALDVLVVPPGESPAFLAPWPVTVLAGSVDAAYGGGTDLVDLLARLGLRTLGAFAELPAAVGARAFRPSRRARAPARVRPGGARTGGDRPTRGVARVDRARPAGDAGRRSRVRGEDARRPHAGTTRRAGVVLRARVVVEAETEHGERLTRCWRHEGALTPSALVARVSAGSSTHGC